MRQQARAFIYSVALLCAATSSAAQSPVTYVYDELGRLVAASSESERWHAEAGPRGTARTVSVMTRLMILDEDEQNAGVVIPLKDIVRRLPLARVHAWLVKDLEGMGTAPFAIEMAAFETLTINLQYGVLLTSSELAVFQDPGVQVTDGEFTGLTLERLTTATTLYDLQLLTLRCVDSSFWECESDDEEILETVRRRFIVREST